MTDPIADYLTRLRSNLKKEITKILFEKGYILNYKFIEDGPQGTIKVALKYDPATKANAIKCLKRVSTPGLRKYTGYKDMPSCRLEDWWRGTLLRILIGGLDYVKNRKIAN